jgi:hypothetical protein
MQSRPYEWSICDPSARAVLDFTSDELRDGASAKVTGGVGCVLGCVFLGGSCEERRLKTSAVGGSGGGGVWPVEAKGTCERLALVYQGGGSYIVGLNFSGLCTCGESIMGLVPE